MSESQEMFFFIADISGYTSYMLANHVAGEHAKLSISYLIASLIKKIQIPLKISKLEGDAIFMYLVPPARNKEWLTEKIFTFFHIFEQKIQELKLSNLCLCGACQNIDQLQLKVVGHYGEATLQKIGPFKELAGVDVIIIHRLLKNHIPKHRYFLLTEAAYEKLSLPTDLPVSKTEEVYDDVGKMILYVSDPPPLPPQKLPNKVSMLFKMKHWMLLHFKKVKENNFRNLPKV